MSNLNDNNSGNPAGVVWSNIIDRIREVKVDDSVSIRSKFGVQDADLLRFLTFNERIGVLSCQRVRGMLVKVNWASATRPATQTLSSRSLAVLSLARDGAIELSRHGVTDWKTQDGRQYAIAMPTIEKLLRHRLASVKAWTRGGDIRCLVIEHFNMDEVVKH